MLDYTRRTNQIEPDVELKALNFINLGYQRLLSYEIEGGIRERTVNKSRGATLRPTAYIACALEPKHALESNLHIYGAWEYIVKHASVAKDPCTLPSARMRLCPARVT